MRLFLANMTLGVTGTPVFASRSQAPGTPAVPEPIGTASIHDEFSTDGGLGGGGAGVADGRSTPVPSYPEPTHGQRLRFHLRGLSRLSDDIIRDVIYGESDPPDAAFYQPKRDTRRRNGTKSPPKTPPPGGPSPKRTRRTEERPTFDVGTDWTRIVEKLAGEVRQKQAELDAKGEEASRYRQRAEEYAAAALRVVGLEKQVRNLENQLRESAIKNEGLTEEVATLRQELSKANTALEATMAELVKAKAIAEENVALIHQVVEQTAQIENLQSLVDEAHAEVQEMRDAVTMSEQIIKVAGMEQRLRVRAEEKAEDLLRYIDSLEVGLKQERQSLSSLLHKAVVANRRIDSNRTSTNIIKSDEFEDLKAELTAKQSEIDDLKLQLLNVEALKEELERVRQELATEKASGQAAQDKVAKHQAAKQVAITQSSESSTFLQENEHLREKLATARQEATEAHETAETLKVELATAREDLSCSEAARREAQAEAAKYKSAAEAAEAKLLEENRQLREQTAAARAEADKAREDLDKASKEGLRQRRRANQAKEKAAAEKARTDKAEAQAKVEKARADRNERHAKDRERLVNENIDLRLEVELLQARMRGHAKIAAGVKGSGVSRASGRTSHPSDSGVALHPDVTEAFRILRLNPTATYKEFRSACGARLNMYHPDSVKERPEPVRKMAAEELQAVIAAGNILNSFFEQKKAAAADRNCA